MLTHASRLAILFFASTAFMRAAEAPPLLPVEQQVAEAIQSPKLTVVHFWAPWCSNCQAELKSGGWKETLEANPDVHFVFVTVWNDKDGRAELGKYGIGAQKNLTVLLHPNSSRKTGEKVRAFMGMDMPWLPTTWVFKGGKLFYSIGYGEMHFPILQQFIQDSSEKWEH